MSNEEQMRADFENIAQSYEWSLAKDSIDDYLNSAVHVAWTAWKACAAQYDGLMEDNQAFQREIEVLNEYKRIHSAHEDRSRVGMGLEIERLNKQVLELSAQAEQRDRCISELCDCLHDVGSGKGGWAWEEVIDDAKESLSTPPSSALLAHDNEVSAKELEEAADETYGINRILTSADLRRMATERRNRK